MKVGIITMFHNSTNYGGILQSYALVKILELSGIDAEQISYDMFSASNIKGRLKHVLYPYYRLLKEHAYIRLRFKIHNREKIIKDASRKLVKHTEIVYTERTIPQCVGKYDAFITGSDQVWRGKWPAYFLTFVPSTIPKIAYAASTGKTILTGDEIQLISNMVGDFKAISVREGDTARQLEGRVSGIEVKQVLDPTLLLDCKYWEKITSERCISNAYIFCYFLGPDVKMRKLALNYAAKHYLKIVTIPHMQGRIEKNDLSFGDVQLFDATPQVFLSCIKYAEKVFTDSFHASVFSQIYGTQYYVFGRAEEKEMNNRIITLTEIFGTRNHFIDEIEKYKVDYIDGLSDINLKVVNALYERMKNESIRFLLDSLKG